MPIRVKLLIATMLGCGVWSIWWSDHLPADRWVHFSVYLVAVLLSSGLKVAMPRGDGTMSVNFPFILLGVLELYPAQAIALAAISVFAQCRVRVLKAFTFVQIAFNVCNAIVATALTTIIFNGISGRHLELAPALAVGSVVYFLANTIPVALVIAWSKGENPLLLWRRQFPWYLPFYLVGAVLAVLAHLISLRYGWLTSLLLIPMVYTIYRAYRTQMAAMADRQRHLEETEALHLRTIEGLAMAIEAKDQNTHDHLLRVRVYVSEIGKTLGLGELDMKALLTASFLHDIGKLAVPEHIINKPGKLTQEEFEKMKIHPVVGADILERVKFPYPVVPIVRSHHEAWDGSGYPDGLKGEEIPVGARILTAVDCFDALASDRPYRRAMPLDKVMELMKSKAGTQFDPAVIKILEERHVELEELARKAGEEIAPLITDVTVERGAAPGAGFQQEGKQATAAPVVPNTTGTGKHEILSKANLQALDLIAAASHEAQAIFEVSQMLGNSLSSNETISVMSARLRRTIPFDSFAVYLRTGDLLTIQYLDGVGAQFFSSKVRIPTGEGLSGWVASSGRPILNGNPKVEPHYIGNSNNDVQLCSALSLPLFDLNKEVLGVVTLYAAAADVFSNDHLRMLLAVQSKFSLSLQNALRFRSAEQDAKVDFITELPNVRQFFARMETELDSACASGKRLGIVVCDLNSFKEVNDRHGHATGNLLLKAIADRFRACCSSEDTVARIGGDEFVFLFPDLAEDGSSFRLNTIESAVKAACASLDLGLNVTTSIGAAFFPQDGETSEDLLAMADRRMYSHKRASYDEHELRGIRQRCALELMSAG